MKAKFFFWALALTLLTQIAPAQSPLPPQVEKELAQHASDVTEVTLDKNMLGFAARFMNGKHKDDATIRQLIQGLDMIYVREYRFDKDGQYSQDLVERLHQAFSSPEWSTLVKERDRKRNTSSSVLFKVVNGENRGLFVLDAQPHDLSIVLILGQIKLEDLGKLQSLSGLGGTLNSLSGLSGSAHSHGNAAGGKK